MHIIHRLSLLSSTYLMLGTQATYYRFYRRNLRISWKDEDRNEELRGKHTEKVRPICHGEYTEMARADLAHG